MTWFISFLISSSRSLESEDTDSCLASFVPHGPGAEAALLADLGKAEQLWRPLSPPLQPSSEPWSRSQPVGGGKWWWGGGYSGLECRFGGYVGVGHVSRSGVGGKFGGMVWRTSVEGR